MRLILSSVHKKLCRSISREDGQELVEYALVIGLVALAATASVSKLASDINNVFTVTGSTLTNNL